MFHFIYRLFNTSYISFAIETEKPKTQKQYNTPVYLNLLSLFFYSVSNVIRIIHFIDTNDDYLESENSFIECSGFNKEDTFQKGKITM